MRDVLPEKSGKHAAPYTCPYMYISTFWETPIAIVLYLLCTFEIDQFIERLSLTGDTGVLRGQ